MKSEETIDQKMTEATLKKRRQNENKKLKREETRKKKEYSYLSICCCIGYRECYYVEIPSSSGFFRATRNYRHEMEDVPKRRQLENRFRPVRRKRKITLFE